MNWAGQCRWLMVETREICYESIICQGRSVLLPVSETRRQLSAPLAVTVNNTKSALRPVHTIMFPSYMAQSTIYWTTKM